MPFTSHAPRPRRRNDGRGHGRLDRNLNPLIEPYERLAASAGSYAEFEAALNDAAAAGDAALLARSLGAALFKARAIGDVRDEA
ncbi:hypothetical protein ACIQTU_08630 [Brevundimonas sp. NPDC090276]|uniref:hypothetical protein n=1 Tax=Brevundimonas sp. NPDC090276 TaxID=3363956 RepID=UPI00383B0EA9